MHYDTSMKTRNCAMGMSMVDMWAVRNTHEDDKYTEDLKHQPSIRRNRSVVFQQLSLRS